MNDLKTYHIIHPFLARIGVASLMLLCTSCALADGIAGAIEDDEEPTGSSMDMGAEMSMSPTDMPAEMAVPSQQCSEDPCATGEVCVEVDGAASCLDATITAADNLFGNTTSGILPLATPPSAHALYEAGGDTSLNFFTSRVERGSTLITWLNIPLFSGEAADLRTFELRPTTQSLASAPFRLDAAVVTDIAGSGASAEHAFLFGSQPIDGTEQRSVGIYILSPDAPTDMTQPVAPFLPPTQFSADTGDDLGAVPANGDLRLSDEETLLRASINRSGGTVSIEVAGRWCAQDSMNTQALPCTFGYLRILPSSFTTDVVAASDADAKRMAYAMAGSADLALTTLPGVSRAPETTFTTAQSQGSGGRTLLSAGFDDSNGPGLTLLSTTDSYERSQTGAVEGFAPDVLSQDDALVTGGCDTEWRTYLERDATNTMHGLITDNVGDYALVYLLQEDASAAPQHIGYVDNPPDSNNLRYGCIDLPDARDTQILAVTTPGPRFNPSNPAFQAVVASTDTASSRRSLIFMDVSGPLEVTDEPVRRTIDLPGREAVELAAAFYEDVAYTLVLDKTNEEVLLLQIDKNTGDVMR